MLFVYAAILSSMENLYGAKPTTDAFIAAMLLKQLPAMTVTDKYLCFYSSYNSGFCIQS